MAIVPFNTGAEGILENFCQNILQVYRDIAARTVKIETLARSKDGLRKCSIHFAIYDDLRRHSKGRFAQLCDERAYRANHLAWRTVELHDTDVILASEFRLLEVARDSYMLLSQEAYGKSVAYGRVQETRDLFRSHVARALLKAITHGIDPLNRTSRRRQVLTPWP